MAYIRKTIDEWHIMANYGYGWEVVTIETTYQDARQMLKDYNENEPQYSHKIKKVRIKKEA